METEDPPLPTRSGGRSALLGAYRHERSHYRPVKLQVSVDSGRVPLAYWGVLAAAILVGGSVGLKLGSNAGAAPEVVAARPDPAQESAQIELARLGHDLRGLRAQLEQLRYGAETLRVADRLKALESASEAAQIAQAQIVQTQAQAQTAAAAAATAPGARFDEIDARIARLEHAGVDMVATGSVKRHAEPEPRRPAGH
jgi:hypothetical protein